ncbi:MAG: GDP-L-fucose synthase [Veillonellales bacterium]
MAKILVTGANGLVGHAIRYLNPPDTVYLTREDVDLTDFNKTLELFSAIKPDQVIHLAAVVGGLGGNMVHPGQYFRDNIMLNTNVLESARICGAAKLISFMSTCVFPDQCQYPLNEKNLHNGPPHPSNFGYAYAKRMLEVQSRAYRKEWGCDYIVAVPTNIYGPGDNWNLADGHVLPALIHRCFLAKQNHTDLIVWGSGSPLREFVYSEDIARLALWTLEHYSEDSPIIFSSGNEISIKAVVKLIVKEFDFSGNVIFDFSKPDGQFRKPSDTTKLNTYLPGFQFTTIEDGLKRTIQWFLNNYPNIRK